MSSIQDLKRRLRSISNTRKVTRAMELVASARLRRAQQRIEALRPYADRMQELMAGTARAAGAVRLPLLQRRENVKTVAIVPITADRGLAGGFNAQVLRRALAEAYVNEEVDRVLIVYNAFVSPLVQRVTVTEVLPIPEHVLETSDEETTETRLVGDFIYEPEPEEILARLLPVYVETELYRALLESAASEQGARMTAMRNASKAAGELIDSLTLAMNRARQAEITQEILEVVAGADALTG